MKVPTNTQPIVLAALVLATACVALVVALQKADTLETTTIVGGAGDIAGSHSRDADTADLVKDVLASDPSAMAYTLGDMAYPYGTASDFNNKYEPTWGQFKGRTLPVVGNHEYYDGSGTAKSARAYWAFQNDAYDLDPTYYSVPLNADWQFVALDSSKSEDAKASGAPSCTTQEAFLVNQLKAAKAAGNNVVAAFHHSRFSNGSEWPTDSTGCPRRFFDAMVQYDGDLVISSHSHLYERFSKRDASGAKVADGVNGVTQITCGTGGATLDGIRTTKSPAPDKLSNNVWGVCKVSFAPDSYTLSFIKTPASPTFSDTLTERVNP